MALFGLFQP